MKLVLMNLLISKINKFLNQSLQKALKPLITIQIQPRQISSKVTIPEPSEQDCAYAAQLAQEAILELIWNATYD